LSRVNRKLVLLGFERNYERGANSQRFALPAADDYKSHRQQDNNDNQNASQPHAKGGQVRAVLEGV
jgi:hypothetical protein